MKTKAPMKNIRNFSIIAHIDHGKSTLADCLISECNAISNREMTSQVMDTMDIEKERGITIKAQSVRLNYTFKGEDYVLTLLTPQGMWILAMKCLALCVHAKGRY